MLFGFVGPTLATSGLALQVPIAIVSDAILKHPTWLDSVSTIVFTLVGGTIIVAAFFGLNIKGQEEDEEADTNSETATLFPSPPSAT